jgi:uncharacterized protein YndB with AHSA1/START domain
MDDPNERTLRIETEIGATPEQVWKAISEAEGIMSWFAPEARVTPGEGGRIFLSFGPGMEGEAPIRVWEPGRRLVWIEGEGAPRERRVEFEIEARDGGKSVLRLVHSGFEPGASFDDELENLNGGWRTFFVLLRYAVERFPSQPAVNVWLFRMLPHPVAHAWPRLLAALGIDTLTEGERYRASLGGITLQGSVLGHPKSGYLALRVGTAGDSALALFVERAGESSLFTVEWVLYGGARSLEPQVRAALGTFVEGYLASL